MAAGSGDYYWGMVDQAAPKDCPKRVALSWFGLEVRIWISQPRFVEGKGKPSPDESKLQSEPPIRGKLIGRCGTTELPMDRPVRFYCETEPIGLEVLGLWGGSNVSNQKLQLTSR